MVRVLGHGVIGLRRSRSVKAQEKEDVAAQAERQRQSDPPTLRAVPPTSSPLASQLPFYNASYLRTTARI